MTEELKKIAHDLRGSLTVIKGFMRYLQQDVMSAEKKEFYQASCRSLEKIENNLDDLQKVIKTSFLK